MTASPNPAKDTSTLDANLRTILHEACHEAELSPADARVLHHYANVVILLPDSSTVARISLNTSPDRALTSVAVTRWLATEQAFPVTAPITGTAAVVVDDTTVVTFWRYYPQPETRQGLDSANLARLLSRLHSLSAPPVELPQWEPLRSLYQLVESDIGNRALTRQERRWLLDRITSTQDAVIATESELGWGHVHGDAWAGNLMWDHEPQADNGGRGILLGDWDSVCYGPREIDLIPSWHAAVRYGKGPEWARAFALNYGYDLSRWPGFHTLFVMRDLIQLAGPLRRAGHNAEFADALRQRMAGIRAGDQNQWREF